MLDEYFIKTSVLRIIKEIKSNERYFMKNSGAVTDSFICMNSEAALYIFYDALYKYKVIIDDEFLFDDYIDQIEKLYRKLNTFDDIRFGINKLICKILITKFSIKDTKNSTEREIIIKHVYDRYIKNGYFIHGFNSSYIDDIRNNGFTPEVYDNYYYRFSKINQIFEKYNCAHILNKDFNDKNVYFTDDLIMGCYYSNYSPLFYYKFLLNEDAFGKRIRKDNCLICDGVELTRHLKRFMNNNSFSDSDKKYILDVVEDEWNLLHRGENKISLLLVKRNLIFSKDAKENSFLRDDKDIYEVIDRMLSSKYNNLEYSEIINKDDFEIMELDSYYDLESIKIKEKLEEEKYKKKKEEVNNDFSNKYGSVSILILLGSIFISLGVIFMIINILGR